jgi:hypothetical protein
MSIFPHVCIALLAGISVVQAQTAPRDFRQHTPPAPGVVVETARDALRLTPKRIKPIDVEPIGLPTSGVKATSEARLDDVHERDAGQASQ